MKRKIGRFWRSGAFNRPRYDDFGKGNNGLAFHPERLMTYEQYYQVNLSSLLSEPLFIGCPIEQLDTFTLNLLSYDEVIKINQNPLCRSVRLVSKKMAYKFGLAP